MLNNIKSWIFFGHHTVYIYSALFIVILLLFGVKVIIDYRLQNAKKLVRVVSKSNVLDQT